MKKKHPVYQYKVRVDRFTQEMRDWIKDQDFVPYSVISMVGNQEITPRRRAYLLSERWKAPKVWEQVSFANEDHAFLFKIGWA